MPPMTTVMSPETILLGIEPAGIRFLGKHYYHLDIQKGCFSNDWDNEHISSLQLLGYVTKLQVWLKSVVTKSSLFLYSLNFWVFQKDFTTISLQVS